MNEASVCHEIDGCPGLYVDAFRGLYLRRTQDPNCTFVLTHYHGDHYGSLPRDGKYQGPAQIHCTPVTASLLISVHQVPAQYVVEHKYGEIWTVLLPPSIKNHQSGEQKSDTQCQEAKIAFYDANHCPGAAIVLIQLADGSGYHLHCGDMRYHPRMKEYPLLKVAVFQRKLDLVYLDTTYGHPKHDFVPQEQAVDTIASKVQELLGETRPQHPSTLVLLSCYSIGKEKVLWEAAKRTNQLVYVSERKLKMMECIRDYAEEDSSAQIHRQCTRDASASDIHVIPMGVAGEMHPYFQPNFRSCVAYAHELGLQYENIVAFIPTGWANASNWNKKNATSQKRVQYDDNSAWVNVEVRLVAYSEHSAFSELQAFVKFLRPRKVIPTVFSNEADCRKIESRFRNLIDSTRAKQAFFKSMRTLSSKANKSAPVHQTNDKGETQSSDDDAVEIIAPVQPDGSNTQQNGNGVFACIEKVESLVAMGFDRNSSQTALQNQGGNMEASVNELLSITATPSSSSSSSSSKKQPSPPKSGVKRKASSPPITKFFQVVKKS